MAKDNIYIPGVVTGIDNRVGDLATLKTNDKTTVVEAINENTNDIHNKQNNIGGFRVNKEGRDFVEFLDPLLNEDSSGIRHHITRDNQYVDLKEVRDRRLKQPFVTLPELGMTEGAGTWSFIDLFNAMGADSKIMVDTSHLNYPRDIELISQKGGTITLTRDDTFISAVYTEINENGNWLGTQYESRMQDGGTFGPLRKMDCDIGKGDFINVDLTTDAPISVHIGAYLVIEKSGIAHAHWAPRGVTGQIYSGDVYYIQSDLHFRRVFGTFIEQLFNKNVDREQEIGTLSNLATTDKSNLVSAINEVKKSVHGGNLGEINTSHYYNDQSDSNRGSFLSLKYHYATYGKMVVLYYYINVKRNSNASISDVLLPQKYRPKSDIVQNAPVISFGASTNTGTTVTLNTDGKIAIGSNTSGDNVNVSGTFTYLI